MMDGTIRVRSVAWFAAAVVLALICTLLVTQAWSVDAAPGDDDSTFVPTAGCRLVDTRPAPRTVGPRSTPLGAGDIYEVTVHGANGECTGALAIPSDAVAVALNVTAVNATASSNIRLYPADLPSVPTLSNLNVTAGAPPTPNKVDVKLSPDGKINVFNFDGSVNVILDVVGHYTDSSLQELTTDLGTAQSDIGALEGGLGTAQSDIGALEALNAGPRLTALEGVFGENTQQANPGRGGDCYLGEIILTAGTVAHGGALANGQLLSISTNTALFSLLGTTYGGDGRTTFGLPDLRNAAPSGLTYTICTSGLFPSRS